MALLRIIFFMFAAMLVMHLFRKYIRPIIQAANHINEREQRNKNTITYIPKKKKRDSRDDDGEYIEYHEIKG